MQVPRYDHHYRLKQFFSGIWIYVCYRACLVELPASPGMCTNSIFAIVLFILKAPIGKEVLKRQ
jgi:hypothetical protein